MSTIAKTNMGTPLFHEFKKQASFFLKEKIKTARLALTDVTPAELLAEEATNGNWSPDTKTLGTISRSAFELDDYWRIVEILHKRLLSFDRNNWRVSYNALLVLEHLLTHGPESVAEEFQGEKDVIKDMESFQHIDEKGFNWGLTVRKKSEKILKLLEKRSLLKEERSKARNLTRGIRGFGSFCQHTLSTQIGMMDRSNSTCNNNINQEMDILPEWNNSKELDNLNSDHQKSIHLKKENLDNWSYTEDINPLLGDKMDKQKIPLLIEDDHPFYEDERRNNTHLLYARDEIL